MNYLNINQNIWHSATVSGILKTRLRGVCCPLNAMWMLCRRVDNINSLSPCSKVLLAAVSAHCSVSDETCIYGTSTAVTQSSSVYTSIIEEPLFVKKWTIMCFIAPPWFIATLYCASSPVRLFSFKKMLWKITVLPSFQLHLKHDSEKPQQYGVALDTFSLIKP